MESFTSRPAMIQQIDMTRGDLFAAVTESESYVVRAEHAVDGADRARKTFVPGALLLDAEGAPVFLAMLQEAVFAPCVRVPCSTVCQKCYGSMLPIEEAFVCESCKLIIPLPAM